MKQILNLTDCPWIVVYRACVAILQADPTLAGIVREDAWIVWDGEDASPSPLSANRDVAVRVSPVASGEEWYSPDSTIRNLSLNIDFDVQSTCINDPHNFWQAVQRAFYPPDDATIDNPATPRFTIINTLVAAGAWTGVLTFSGPNVIPDDAKSPSYFSCRGVLKLEVDNRLNS